MHTKTLHTESSHGHGHTGLARHDHAAGDASVVYVEENNRLYSPDHVPAPTRGVHDLDGLMRRLALPPDTGVPERWFAVEPPLIRSRMTPPLERPPHL